MNSVKKIVTIATFICLAIVTNVSAQEQEAEVKKAEVKKAEGTKLGIRAGFHLSSMGPLDLSAGWHVGAVSDLVTLTTFEPSFLNGVFGIYVQPGLLFLTRDNVWGGSTYWLEIPAMISLKCQFKETGLFGITSGFRLEIGPYFDIGIIGDFEHKLTDLLGNEIKSKMGRFDVGLASNLVKEYGIVWIATGINSGFLSVSDDGNYSTFTWKVLTIGINL